MPSALPPWSRDPRLLAVVAALVVVGAGLAFLVRDLRTQSSAPSPRPSSTEPVVHWSGAASSSPSASASPTCVPGQSGPLRKDAEFTADDRGGVVVRYSVSLPDDYYTSCKTYPVVYALHGKNQDNVGFLDDALTMRKAMAAGVLDDAIIVTPDSYATGRWENRDTGPAEDNFVKSLIPFVEENYRVRPGPAYRLLVGFSMGGHGAFRFGLKYPQSFAAVWSVDGAMADNDAYLQFVAGKTSADFHIRAVGGRLNGSRVQTVIDALKERGIDIPYNYEDVDHDFKIFEEADEKAGWPAMKYLQANLGRPVQ